MSRRSPLPLPTRDEAVRFALASTRLAGGEITGGTAALLAEWASGRMDGEELARRAVAADRSVRSPA